MLRHLILRRQKIAAWFAIASFGALSKYDCAFDVQSSNLKSIMSALAGGGEAEVKASSKSKSRSRSRSHSQSRRRTKRRSRSRSRARSKSRKACDLLCSGCACKYEAESWTLDGLIRANGFADSRTSPDPREACQGSQTEPHFFFWIAFRDTKNCESQVWGDSGESPKRHGNSFFCSVIQFARIDSHESPRFALRTRRAIYKSWTS